MSLEPYNNNSTYACEVVVDATLILIHGERCGMTGGRQKHCARAVEALLFEVILESNIKNA